jgi:hypothetical protein
MSDITASVSNGSTVSASIASTSGTTVQAVGIQGLSASQTGIAGISDVDLITNGVQHGSILVYQATTSLWTSSNLLDSQNMEGGEF